MLSVQKAFTLEIDDVDAAVAEIIKQLDLEALRTHTVGIIAALPAFIESGVVAALQEALPFDLVGQTSIATSLIGYGDMDQLNVMVLSSDDVEFSVALSEPVDGSDQKPVEATYAKAAASHSEKPELILSCAPLVQTASADFFVRGLSAASEGVPVFGGIAVDDTIDYHDARVIYKGAAYTDRLACILLYGDIRPRFYLATLTYGKVFEETGLVTDSEGSLLKTINDAPVSQFLKNIGIQPNDEGEFPGINTYPYLVDYDDGSDSVIRVMFAVTPEGYAVCGGDIPEGAILSVSLFDSTEILESSKATITQLSEDIARHNAQVVLAYSCIGRYFSLGIDSDAEAKLLQDALAESGVPHAFTYCGGEQCPVGSKDGSDSLTNRAHNSTFIAVVL